MSPYLGKHNSKNVTKLYFLKEFELSSLLKWDQNAIDLNTVITSHVLISLDQGLRQIAEKNTWEEMTVLSSMGFYISFLQQSMKSQGFWSKSKIALIYVRFLL